MPHKAKTVGDVQIPARPESSSHTSEKRSKSKHDPDMADRVPGAKDSANSETDQPTIDQATNQSTLVKKLEDLIQKAPDTLKERVGDTPGITDLVPSVPLNITEIAKRSVSEALDLILKKRVPGSSGQSAQSAASVPALPKAPSVDKLLSELKSLALTNPIEEVVKDHEMVKKIQNLLSELKAEGSTAANQGLMKFQQLFDEFQEMKLSLGQVEAEKSKFNQSQVDSEDLLGAKQNQMLNHEEQINAGQKELEELTLEIARMEERKKEKMKAMKVLMKEKETLKGECQQEIECWAFFNQEFENASVKEESIQDRISELKKMHLELMTNPPF